jgi:hypothetical protein
MTGGNPEQDDIWIIDAEARTSLRMVSPPTGLRLEF